MNSNQKELLKIVENIPHDQLKEIIQKKEKENQQRLKDRIGRFIVDKDNLIKKVKEKKVVKCKLTKDISIQGDFSMDQYGRLHVVNQRVLAPKNANPAVVMLLRGGLSEMHYQNSEPAQVKSVRKKMEQAYKDLQAEAEKYAKENQVPIAILKQEIVNVMLSK